MPTEKAEWQRRGKGRLGAIFHLATQTGKWAKATAPRPPPPSRHPAEFRVEERERGVDGRENFGGGNGERKQRSFTV